ncbi:hypothetical protein [Rhodoblastus sp.]|jgi:hypothetical protein|uniref:hypothetical protein n=1 Tax=Rhodoblastus sp. TaxID=1962975 RepID=UPI0026114FCD|nr:hypothetical protein [Rhodoblastus sp.]
MSRVLVPTLLSLAGLCALAGAATAQTRTCQGEITRLETLIAQTETGGPPVPDTREGAFATMHRQPTTATILAADKDARARAKAALDSARKAQAQGKEAACLKALDDIAF